MPNSNAKHDDNNVATLLGVNDSTGFTQPIKVDSNGRELVVATLAGVTVAGGGTGVTSFTAYAVICGGTTSTGALQNVSGVGTSGQVLTSNGAAQLPTWQTVAAGTVTSVSVVTANGVSGSVATATTTPAITLTLGAITPTSVNGLTVTTTTGTLTIASAKTLTVSNTLTLAGTDSTVMTFPTTSATIARTDAANTFTGIQSFTSPDTTTSITTASTSFTAWAGATTLLTIGGTGASASLFAPSTLDATSSTTGAIRTSGGISAAKAMNCGTTLTIGTSIELGHATDTTLTRSAAGVMAVEGVVIPSISSTNTLTNKRITRRLTTTNAPGATPTINTDNLDVANLTGLGTAITSLTTNLSGTPVDGDMLEIRFTDDGTARGITFGASFVATTVALPTTTVISTMLRALFEWNGSAWAVVATA